MRAGKIRKGKPRNGQRFPEWNGTVHVDFVVFSNNPSPVDYIPDYLKELRLEEQKLQNTKAKLQTIWERVN